jgi:nucleoprotein TPR
MTQAPLLREQRIEYDRLSTEATHLASQLAQALSDRDIASRHTESYRLNLERLSLDNTIMTSQLRDLGRQLRTVTRNLGSRDISGIAERSLGDGDEEEMAIMKRAEESNDTDAIVSAHLVTFQSINDLQVQNQKLLRITREMGLQMERGEEESIARRRGEENSAVSEAHEMILRLKDEVESQRAKTEAFVRERDMFRRMLSQRGSLGDSNGVESALTAGSTGDTHGSGTDVDTPRILADVQANFDAYRSEIAIDTQRLRDDLTQSQHDANSARTELAKTKAQSEFLSGQSIAFIGLGNSNYLLTKRLHRNRTLSITQ